METFASHSTAGSRVGTTRDIRSMYERFPYPPSEYDGFKLTVPWILQHLGLDLSNKSVLDFGCGTGKKLAAMARAFPSTRFTGIDLSAASLNAARENIDIRDSSRVTLLRGDLFSMELPEQFDVIISLGVVHHLEQPLEGLRRMSAFLADNGLVILTLYHSLGTFPTLATREVLLSLLGNRRNDLSAGVELLEDFLQGQQVSQAAGLQANQSEIASKVDALINPIVNAYRFDDCLNLVRESGFSWGMIDFALFGKPLQRGVIDFGVGSQIVDHAIDGHSLFPDSPLCQEKFNSLDLSDKLRIAELVLTPSISGVVAGNSHSFENLDERVQQNVVVF